MFLEHVDLSRKSGGDHGVEEVACGWLLGEDSFKEVTCCPADGEEDDMRWCFRHCLGVRPWRVCLEVGAEKKKLLGDDCNDGKVVLSAGSEIGSPELL